MLPKLLFWTVLICVSILAFLPTYEPLPEVVSFSDVLNHFAAFSTLYVLHAVAYPRLSIMIRGVLLLGYGLFIEAVQSFLPNRVASAEDIAVDAAGILAALLLQQLFQYMRRAAL